MSKKSDMKKTIELLKSMDISDKLEQYIECPVCGGKQMCRLEITRIDWERAREILTCDYCGYIMDSTFPIDGIA